MIYFDNAATTMHKPPQVVEAVTQALCGFGGVGRGVHSASLSAGMAVYDARDAIARLFNAPDASRVSFTSNVTEALNIALSGLIGTGDHVVTTAASHNSVLRPLHRLQGERGVSVGIAPIGADGALDLDAFAAAFEPGTRLAIVTHASNLTGDIYDIAAMASIAHSRGAAFVVDAAQTAGCVPIDMAEMGIDVLCFTGHKGLMGPQGTGGLCLAQGVEIPPYKVGGTGTHSYEMEHPAAMPEGLEAGTLNAHGIAGLAAGVQFIEETGVGTIAAHERSLAQRFEEGVSVIPGIKLYGGPAAGRTGICCLNFKDVDSGIIADALSNQYDICTRAGAHCAPLMHKALGTEAQGAVRFSFGWYNTADEVDEALAALTDIANSL